MSNTTNEDNIYPKVNLLPGFDEYLLGYRDRGASIDLEQVKKKF